MSTTQSSSSGDGKAAKKESPKSTSTTESKSDSSTASSGGGKSSRDSIGGSKEVHYGYFSSVRTPEYRSGWGRNFGARNPRRNPRQNRKPRPKARSILTLSSTNYRPTWRDGLMEHARKKLRRTPAGFKKLQEAGDIEWTFVGSG